MDQLLFSSLLGLALIGGPLFAYFQHHSLLAEFKYYAFDIFFEGSYGTGFSPDVGSVGLLRSGLIMLLPAFIDAMHASRGLGRAERLRALIAKLNVNVEHPVTASIGLAFATAPTSELGALLSSADKAMYHAKASGRFWRYGHCWPVPMPYG